MADTYRQPTHAGGPQPTFGGGMRPNLEPENWSSVFSDEHAVEMFPVPSFARLIGQIFFQETNSDELDKLDKETLENLSLTCSVIEKEEPLRFWFVGLADHRGSRDYNLKLGKRRAANACVFFRSRLESLQPQSSQLRFHIRSWGESRKQQKSKNISRPGTSPENYLNLSKRERYLASLANWRRVDIYTNIPRGDFKRAEKSIQNLHQRLQKWAGQALRRHREAIIKLSKQAERYKTHTLHPGMLKGADWSAGLAYLENITMLDMYVARMEEMQERYLDLQRALEMGDAGFLAWHKKWFGNRQKGQERLQRMRDLYQKLKTQLESASQKEKSALKNVIEALEEEIRAYAEDLNASYN